MAGNRRKPVKPGILSNRPKTERTADEAAIRVIGGELRRRVIKVNVDPRTRPMKDRTRQAMFNLLGNHLDGCIAFDLFGGTGVIGIEAVSRGANHAVIVELLPHLAKSIRGYVDEFKIPEKVTVHRGNAFDYLIDYEESIRQLGALPWLVFICPPFPMWASDPGALVGLLNQWIEKSPVGSRFVCELDFDCDPSLLPDCLEWSVRDYRPANIAIATKRPDAELAVAPDGNS
jgi:16S rRNA (guanine966-N2)-methyltransferase